MDFAYWGERSEARRVRYSWDFVIILIMDVRPTDLIQLTCTCTLLSKIEEELLARLLQLTLGYHWLSGKLIRSLYIHASHTWLLAVMQHNLSCITSSCVYLQTHTGSCSCSV